MNEFSPEHLRTRAAIMKLDKDTEDEDKKKRVNTQEVKRAQKIYPDPDSPRGRYSQMPWMNCPTNLTYTYNPSTAPWVEIKIKAIFHPKDTVTHLSEIILKISAPFKSNFISSYFVAILQPSEAEAGAVDVTNTIL